MLDRFYTGFADTKQTELSRYFKMENVIPAELSNSGRSRNTLKLWLETTAYHLLQRIDKILNAMISHLTVDLEHHGRVQRYVS